MELDYLGDIVNRLIIAFTVRHSIRFWSVYLDEEIYHYYYYYFYRAIDKIASTGEAGGKEIMIISVLF